MRSTIIIPNHNGEKTIKKSLDSIFSENIKDYEFIVVDNNSDDNSIQISKKYPVKIINLKKNYGASKARNSGIIKAKTNNLIFIDSDAWFGKASLKKLIKGLENQDIVFPKIKYENNEILYPILDIEKKYPHISGCFGIKKRSLEKLDEYFDETYETYLEDYDFFMRCRLAGLKAHYIEDAIVYHANKEQKADYRKRYYLELRNTIYGMKKLKKLANKTKMYNPFNFFTLIKNILYGSLNFAWFNWYKNPRGSIKKKINSIFYRKNKISNKLFFFESTLKALKKGLSSASKAKKKNSMLRKLYIKNNYL